MLVDFYLVIGIITLTRKKDMNKEIIKLILISTLCTVLVSIVIVFYMWNNDVKPTRTTLNGVNFAYLDVERVNLYNPYSCESHHNPYYINPVENLTTLDKWRIRYFNDRYEIATLLRFLSDNSGLYHIYGDSKYRHRRCIGICGYDYDPYACVSCANNINPNFVMTLLDSNNENIATLYIWGVSIEAIKIMIQDESENLVFFINGISAQSLKTDFLYTTLFSLPPCQQEELIR